MAHRPLTMHKDKIVSGYIWEYMVINFLFAWWEGAENSNTYRGPIQNNAGGMLLIFDVKCTFLGISRFRVRIAGNFGYWRADVEVRISIIDHHPGPESLRWVPVNSFKRFKTSTVPHPAMPQRRPTYQNTRICSAAIQEVGYSRTLLTMHFYFESRSGARR